MKIKRNPSVVAAITDGLPAGNNLQADHTITHPEVREL